MTFAPGERVTATIWGTRREGMVVKHTSSVVWVLWDLAPRALWIHPDSLTRLGGAR